MQEPSNNQFSNPNTSVGPSAFEYWSLDLVWFLEIGIWNFLNIDILITGMGSAVHFGNETEKAWL
jgi:hypothetical protein